MGRSGQFKPKMMKKKTEEFEGLRMLVEWVDLEGEGLRVQF